VYRQLFGSDAVVTAVHAGLECGLIGERIPDMDMVSFGPQIDGAHAPGERVNIVSVAKFWKLLLAVFEALAGASTDIPSQGKGTR
jgi:dipeptidase D